MHTPGGERLRRSTIRLTFASTFQGSAVIEGSESLRKARRHMPFDEVERIFNRVFLPQFLPDRFRVCAKACVVHELTEGARQIVYGKLSWRYGCRPNTELMHALAPKWLITRKWANQRGPTESQTY